MTKIFKEIKDLRMQDQVEFTFYNEEFKKNEIAVFTAISFSGLSSTGPAFYFYINCDQDKKIELLHLISKQEDRWVMDQNEWLELAKEPHLSFFSKITLDPAQSAMERNQQLVQQMMEEMRRRYDEQEDRIKKSIY